MKNTITLIENRIITSIHKAEFAFNLFRTLVLFATIILGSFSTYFTVTDNSLSNPLYVLFIIFSFILFVVIKNNNEILKDIEKTVTNKVYRKYTINFTINGIKDRETPKFTKFDL